MELKDFIEKFAEQFDETPSEEFEANTEFKELEEWDSLTILTIIAMVDEEFGIKIKAEEIRSVDTVEELFTLVKSMAK